MRELSTGLKQHLEATVTTVCTCWILTRNDGVRLGFTDHDHDLLIEDVACKASSGFSASEAASELGLATDDQEIEGALDSLSISERDLQAGLYDDAEVQVWTVNWQSPDERAHLRTGLLGEFKQLDGVFQAQLKGLTSKLDRSTARTFARHCDALLGDARCGVDLNNNAFAMEGVVEDVTDSLTFSCSAIQAYEPNWFAFGRVEWLSGENAGLIGDLSASASTYPSDLKLWRPMPFAVKVADTFRVTAGCDKSFSLCKSKFGNHLNFRGCPHIPGNDFSLGYAEEDGIHDGGPLFE